MNPIVEQLTRSLSSAPIVSPTRRNHALEHATMSILSSRFPGVRMAGLSSAGGFALLADLPTEIVTDAVLEAQARLKAGEGHLAVHPNCGTNLMTSSLVAGTAAFLAIWGLSGTRKPRWWNYLLSVMVAVPAFIFSRPLGPKVQKVVTTDPDLGPTQVKMVRSQKAGQGYLHLISTGR